MKCLNFSKLITCQHHLLKDAERQEIEKHLLACLRCQKMADELETLQISLKKTTTCRHLSDTSACYDDLELLSFLQGGFKRKAQKNLYAHLARCPACLDKLIGAENLLFELKTEGLLPGEKSSTEIVKEYILNLPNTAGQKIKSFSDVVRVPRPAYRWMGLILLLVLMSFPFWRREKMSEGDFPTREPQTNRIETQIQLSFPLNGESVQDGIPEFRWSGSDRFAFYSFLLLDAEGTIIWEKKTGQTGLVLPPEIRLLSSMTYYWQVEAFFEDEGSVISAMNSFMYVSHK